MSEQLDIEAIKARVKRFQKPPLNGRKMPVLAVTVICIDVPALLERVAQQDERIRELEAGLAAIEKSPEAQLAYLQKCGVEARRVTGYSHANSQLVEAYELELSHDEDARYIYPAREGLVKQVARAALLHNPTQEHGAGERGHVGEEV